MFATPAGFVSARKYGSLLLSAALCFAALSAGAQELPGWSLVWSDEFDGAAIDREKWRFIVGGGGYGNNEMQWYDLAPDNARIEEGVLVIEARKQKKAGWPYTSAKLESREAWTYGRFEARAKLPVGVGSWPAVWMLPRTEVYGSWPNGGEIDVMEHVGYDPGVVHFTAHTAAFNHKAGTQKSAIVAVPDAQEEFHIYAVEWDEARIAFLVDGREVHEFANTGKGWREWPFDQAFYLILNLAVGGDWGGREGVDNASLPWRMYVDWVRVYRADE
ncbi:MAG: glycoside hydrolase family 16 protein [Spirochaetales bacterium]|nr:glycoside hydrolase family 16 protein [Spirochaetales bacterium]